MTVIERTERPAGMAVREGVEGRAAEIREPLLSVADAAGGEWPERAREACLTLALGAPVAGEVTPADELADRAASIGAGA